MIVAIVNGVPITRQQFEERLAQSRSMNPSRYDAMGREERERAIVRVLNAMILWELEYQEAIRQGMIVRDEEVEQEFRALRQNYQSDEILIEVLKQSQITAEKWKFEMRRTLAIRKLEDKLARQIPIGGDELDAYLKATKTPILPPEMRQAQREQIRWILQQSRWGEVRKAWLKALVETAVIWQSPSIEELADSSP